MANGDITRLDSAVFEALLLDAQSATHTGVWVELPPGFGSLAVECSSLEEGAADATVDLHGSNAGTRPADATDGVRIKAFTQEATPPATETRAFQGVAPYRWLKAKKTAGTTPVGTTVRLRAARG